MRISDWSSDVCSSDLAAATPTHNARDGGWGAVRRSHSQHAQAAPAASRATNHQGLPGASAAARTASKIGRASGRERGLTYVLMSVVAVAYKKKNKNEKERHPSTNNQKQKHNQL